MEKKGCAQPERWNAGDKKKKKKKKIKFLVLVFSFMVCLLLQVNYLQNDNALLENKQKELKGTIQILLQSKESFVNAYEVCNL